MFGTRWCITIELNVELLILVDIPVILAELIAFICRVISSNFRVKGACRFEMLVLIYLLHCITFQDIMDYRRCHKKIRFCRWCRWFDVFTDWLRRLQSCGMWGCIIWCVCVNFWGNLLHRIFRVEEKKSKAELRSCTTTCCWNIVFHITVLTSYKTKQSHDLKDQILFLCYCNYLRSYSDVYLL